MVDLGGFEFIELTKQMYQSVYLYLGAHNVRVSVHGRHILSAQMPVILSAFQLMPKNVYREGEPQQWMWISKFTTPFLLPTPDEECERKKKKSGPLVNILKSKQQGLVHGGQSPALPRECAVRSLFR